MSNASYLAQLNVLIDALTRQHHYDASGESEAEVTRLRLHISNELFSTVDHVTRIRCMEAITHALTLKRDWAMLKADIAAVDPQLAISAKQREIYELDNGPQPLNRAQSEAQWKRRQNLQSQLLQLRQISYACYVEVRIIDVQIQKASQIVNWRR